MNIYPIEQWSGNLSHILLNLSRVASTLLLGISIVAAGTWLRCQSTGRVTLISSRPKPLKIPQNPKTIGEHIKKRRLELKLLQKEVASKLGVDECTITNWEKNYSKPMLHLLPKIIEFLGYDPTPDEPKTLGEKILQYRKSRGITQKELARRIGIDPATLSRIERGKGGWFPSILKKVSAFFN